MWSFNFQVGADTTENGPSNSWGLSLLKVGVLYSYYAAAVPQALDELFQHARLLEGDCAYVFPNSIYLALQFHT